MSPPAPAVHRDGPGTAGEGAEPVRWAGPGEYPSEIRPDGVLNGLEIAPVHGGECHRHGVNNQRSDSPYS